MIVSVINQPSHVSSLCTDAAAVDMKSSLLLICSAEMKSDLVNNAPTNFDPADFVTNDPDCNADDPWGENDEIEYVGVDDELVEPADPACNIVSDYIPDTDEEDNDDCAVDDEEGCGVVEHTTDLENPKIVVGVTFEDRETFMSY